MFAVYGLFGYVLRFLREEASTDSERYSCDSQVACVRCHVGLLKISHVTYNKSQKSQIPDSSIMMRRKHKADALFSKR